jgi:hypothetical protein
MIKNTNIDSQSSQYLIIKINKKKLTLKDKIEKKTKKKKPKQMDSTLSWGFKLNRVRVVPMCLYRLNKSKEKKIKGTKKKSNSS